jgi:hypothetical protein
VRPYKNVGLVPKLGLGTPLSRQAELGNYFSFPSATWERGKKEWNFTVAAGFSLRQLKLAATS